MLTLKRRFFRGALFAIVSGLLPALAAVATEPKLGIITPQGAQRGTEIDIRVPGQRLADGADLMFCEPGFKVLSMAADGNDAVKVRLAIAPDCRLGIHGVRIRTATGVSNLTTFHVGALPEASETEPNSDFAAPQKIALDTCINGVVDNEDVDYFLVEAKQGERITVELEGLRLGRTLFDPYVSIMDMGRFELATCDDAALLNQDCVASIIAPKDGTYVIQIRESAYQGNGACAYRAHIGRFPRPTGVYPAGGRPGETLDVHWLGDAAGERIEKVTLPTAPDKSFLLFAKDEKGQAPSGNVFRLSNLDNVLEAEPNGSEAEATVGPAPAAFNGIIAKPGDRDTFKFQAKKGQNFHVRVHARNLRSQLDSVLEITRVGKGRVGFNDDNGAPDSYLRFQVPEDDEYAIAVWDHLQSGGPDYVYRVEVTPIEPEMVIGLAERQQYVATTVEVPRGNRTAFMVNAGRVDFGGEVKVALAGLPAGVALETVNMAANRNEIPMLLSSAADASPAGALVDMIGTATDPNIKVEGHLRQVNGLVRGQNNREFWSYYGDRMALAVTNEVPFKIDIVQPKVPLVQGGSMDLKVVATRAAGFTAPIAIRMLYNPPGVSSSGSVTIPEGQNEAVIPLTTDGGAQVQVWKVVVVGQASVNGGSVIVSTQLADLEIAAPYFTFKYEKAAVEQGQETEVLIHVEKNKDFAGNVKAELVGLPPGATTAPIEFNQDAKDISFKIKTAADAREGKHASLLCRAIVELNGEPITHTIGTGELRVDKPLPPKVNAPAPMPAPMPAAAPAPAAAPEAPKAKPLSRLEKLRLEKSGK